MSRILSRPGDTTTYSPLPRDWRIATNTLESGGAASTRAAQILLQARQQARALVAAAEEQVATVTAAAEQRGWEQGYLEGRQQAQRDLAASTQRLAQLAATAVHDFQASAYQLDRDLTQLALVVARAIVQHEVRVSPETVLDVARTALRELNIDRAVTLRVHPDDSHLLQEQLQALALPESVQIFVVGDTQVNAGGCLVESGSGRIDATIDGQLERLERLLYEQLDATVA